MTGRAPHPTVGAWHRRVTYVLSGVVALLGLAIVAVTVADGGGVTSRGIVFGALLATAGTARAWIARRGAWT
ncbi:MAG: hypothetical protein M0P31_08430 [Solirubrobacteraceae bacterium]|nr:hypothetical protein [Solirubrobacteraceae bacterium]